MFYIAPVSVAETVVGNPEQPGGKFCETPECVKVEICFNKGLLSDVVCQRIVTHTEAK